MRVLSAHEPINEPCAVALGMFDGVHRGHRKVIDKAIAYAKLTNIKSAVITLANHPKDLTDHKAPLLITSLEARLNIFAELGIDYVLVLEFTEELMNLSPEAYLEQYIVKQLEAKFISVGFDHHFGKDRKGSPALLESWCKDHNIILESSSPLHYNDNIVSSSQIRKLISEGNISEANNLLGYSFFIIGTVITGQKQGQRLGFPTANISIDSRFVIPKSGVYQGSVLIAGEQTTHLAAINIGFRPTIQTNSALTIETHLIDYSDDLYGKTIKIVFIDRLRDEIKFENTDALKKQISLDIEEIKALKISHS